MPVIPVLASLLLTVPAPAPQTVTQTATPQQACEGVTVAVALPGELVVRCAHGAADARQALERTGLDLETGRGTGAYGEPDYVCRINGVPAEDDCAGHEDGKPHWKVWRVGLDPVAWRATQTTGGPAGVPVCDGSLVGFSFGTQMPVSPSEVAGADWLPPICR